METITQRSRHSRRVSMTCYLINKTASVLRPKFSRGCAECLPETGDAAAINKRIIVRNTPGIGKQKQLHAARQTSTHCTNGGMRMLAADTPTNDATPETIVEFHPKNYVQFTFLVHDFFSTTFPTHFHNFANTIWGFYADDADKVRMEVSRFLCTTRIKPHKKNTVKNIFMLI